MTHRAASAAGVRGLVDRSGVLLGVSFAALALLSPFLLWQGGLSLLAIGAATAALCSLSCLAGLALTQVLGGSASDAGNQNRFLAGLLGGMFLRLALPLGAALWVGFAPAAIGDAADKRAFLLLLILFYLIALAAETVLILPTLKRRVAVRPRLAPTSPNAGEQLG